MRSRTKEALRIRAANRAVAVVRLMDGQIGDWLEFLEPDLVDLEALPRSALKVGQYDVKRRVSKDIKKFCEVNFDGMTEETLNFLYEDIKSLRGLELSLDDFQNKYARIKRKTLAGIPSHSTVRISLWGLRFEYPEHHLADDITIALANAIEYDKILNSWQGKQHLNLRNQESEIAQKVRLQKFYSRMTILTCFNLVEAYFNSLAWDFIQNTVNASLLSNRDKKLLEDTAHVSLSNKILKYPELIFGEALFREGCDPFQTFVETVKPFRDSLVHASPFSAPERFGGYDKLRMLYRLDVNTAVDAAKYASEIISDTHRKATNGREKCPIWLTEMLDVLRTATSDKQQNEPE